MVKLVGYITQPVPARTVSLSLEQTAAQPAQRTGHRPNVGHLLPHLQGPSGGHGPTISNLGRLALLAEIDTSVWRLHRNAIEPRSALHG